MDSSASAQAEINSIVCLCYTPRERKSYASSHSLSFLEYAETLLIIHNWDCQLCVWVRLIHNGKCKGGIYAWVIVQLG